MPTYLGQHRSAGDGPALEKQVPGFLLDEHSRAVAAISLGVDRNEDDQPSTPGRSNAGSPPASPARRGSPPTTPRSRKDTKFCEPTYQIGHPRPVGCRACPDHQGVTGEGTFSPVAAAARTVRS